MRTLGHQVREAYVLIGLGQMLQSQGEYAHVLAALEQRLILACSEDDVYSVHQLRVHPCPRHAGQYAGQRAALVYGGAIYIRKIRYQPCTRNADGARTYTGTIELYDGQHEALIDEALFAQCQAVREKRVRHRQSSEKYNPYLLRNLVYCYQCCCHRPSTNTFPSYGKMRAQAYHDNAYRCYRCRARELGYSCTQKKVRVEIIEQQVLDILMQLKPPEKWRTSITASIGELLGEKDLHQRLEEIRTVIQRMDQRWDLGFITDEQEYIQQRLELQQELERLTPVDSKDLERATDLLNNFSLHWRRCGDDVEAQATLVGQIIERVYVQEETVVAMTLRSNCHLVLAHKINGPTEYTVDPFITSQSISTPEEPEMDSCGLDGI